MLSDSHPILVLTRLQRAAASPEASSPTDAPISMESPPYSPSPSESERPVLSSRIHSQLRRSCAVIVQETNPPGQDAGDQPDHNETLKRLYEEHNKPPKLPAAQLRPLKAEPQSLFSRRHRAQPSEPSPIPAPYVHIPQNAATSFEATASRRQPLSKQKPVEPVERTETTEAIRVARRESAQLCKLRAAVDTRPKTSAAACIDYTGPSVDTSKSTSRSTTTYDGFARRTSTGLSSLALTPVDDTRVSPTHVRVSEQILRDGPSASLADASAKAWMAQELSRRRDECKTGREARPTVRSPIQRSSIQRKPAEPERPPSRTGTLAGSIAESFREGIKEYIRPRASSDNLRATQSDNKNSRPSSRDGNEGTGNWWRGTLKRKGSWSSFRSSKGAQEEDAAPSGHDGGPNLNRALPALPGLDQYKEKKATPMHISQLMRPGREDGEKKVAKRPSALPEDSYQHFLAQAEWKRHQEDSRREAEMRMRHNAMMASARFELRPQHTTHPQPWRTASDTVAPLPKVIIKEIPKAPALTDKKPGLRKRLSRFWSHGSEKSIDEGRKGLGSMVAAN